MLKRLSAPIAAVSLGAVVLASAGTGAVAQRLIGSKDVADNSLTGKDIKNNTVTGKDVKDGSLSAADISGGLPAGPGVAGPQGPKGDTGAPGPQGPAGPAGSSEAGEFARWDVAFVSNGAGTDGAPTIDTSSEVIAKFTDVEAIDFQVAGDFSSCDEYEVSVQQRGQYLAEVYDFGEPSRDLRDFVVLQEGPLTVRANCIARTPDGFQPLAIPSFTASLLFKTTQLDTSNARTFD